MPKIYVFIFFLALTSTSQAKTDPPVCHEDIVRYIYEGCGEDINDIDLKNADGLDFEYILEGATSGKGTGSASGNFFNTGKTTVIYQYPDGTIICQFAVVVINPSLLELAHSPLDTLKLSCRRRVTERPQIFEHCSGQYYDAETEDSLVFSEKGVYTIHWRYFFAGVAVDKQDQVVVVSDDEVEFIPNEYKLPNDTINCKGEVEPPFGYYGCSPERIFATTNDQTKFDSSGEYTILWVYSVGEKAVYRQQQHVSVNNMGTLIPNEKSLQTISGFCSVKVVDTPFARHSCTGRIEYGRTSDPRSYDKPGKYKITWVFGFIGVRSDTIIKTQIVEVRNGGAILPDRKSLTTYRDSCSVTIVDTPTALVNCGTTRIKAVPRGPLTYTEPGKYTIEWLFTDNYKNSLVQNQEVVIIGGNRIVPEQRVLDTVKGDCSLSISDMPFARNRCTGKRIQASTSDPLNYTGVGNHIIKWLYQDGADTLIQEQVVMVQGKDSLVPELATLRALVGNCDIVVDQPPVARNTCTGKLVTATTESPLHYSSPGPNLIYWVYKDGTAMLSQTQLVVVNESSVSLKVYPNPTNYEFHILAESCQQTEKLSLRVYDAIGRLIETRTDLAFNKEVRFGADYPGTTYFAQVLWGDKQYMYKLVKNK